MEETVKNNGEKNTPKYQWSECPVCHSTATVVGNERDELVKQGKCNPAIRMALVHPQVMVVDPGRITLMLTIPVVTAEVDICVKCGSLRATRADVVQGRPEIRQGASGQAPSPQTTRFPFNKG